MSQSWHAGAGSVILAEESSPHTTYHAEGPQKPDNTQLFVGNKMSSVQFLPTWTYAQHQGYDSIPRELTVEEKQLRGRLEKNTQSWLGSFRGRVASGLLPLTFISAFCLCAFAKLGAHYTEAESHRDTVVPTLLSVVDPSTNDFIYALTNPLYEEFRNATWVSLSESHLAGHETPQLFLNHNEIDAADTTSFSSTRSSVLLTWTMGRHLETGNILVNEEKDVIALFCDESDTFLEVVTLEQARATSMAQGGFHDNSWWIPSWPHLRQETCQFRLYSWWQDSRQDKVKYIHVASSEKLLIKNAKEIPTGIHLSYSDEDESQTTVGMTIQFTTGPVPKTVPVARVAVFNNKRETKWITIKGTSDTYSADDLCQAPGNITEAGKFYEPGMIHTVHVTNLSPKTKYSYQVGLQVDQDNGKVLRWSDQSTFTTPPIIGDPAPFSYVVYGDQGCPHGGWEIGQKWLEAMMQRESNITSVHHFGDISYSRGAAHVWDAWLQMVQPVSTRIPLMVAIGNHEYDHTDGGAGGKDPSGVTTAHGFMPSWGNFGEDSGGECGVTMSKRFRMPQTAPSSNGVFWYSFSYATVHTIVISSEHDLSPGSPQYMFLESELQRVDRNITPWISVESHRPLYEAEGSGKWWPNNEVGVAMRREFEDLLREYQVDLVLSGHYHEYHRTCDGLFKGQCDQGGPMHVTIGSAGATLDNGFELNNHWTEHFIKGQYGYGRVSVANKTHLNIQFVLHGEHGDSQGGLVEDDFWIVRQR